LSCERAVKARRLSRTYKNASGHTGGVFYSLFDLTGEVT